MKSKFSLILSITALCFVFSSCSSVKDRHPDSINKSAEEEKKKTKKKFDPFSPQHIERRQWR